MTIRSLFPRNEIAGRISQFDAVAATAHAGGQLRRELRLWPHLNRRKVVDVVRGDRWWIRNREIDFVIFSSRLKAARQRKPQAAVILAVIGDA